jgi:hypothetical protein
MAKAIPDAILDKTLDEIATATKMTLCTDPGPSTYTEANSTYALADIVIDGSDFTKANGDTSGRKVTISAQSGVLIDTSGTGTHIALIRTADSTLIYVTTCTSQAVTANGSNTVNFPAFDIEIADPS